MEVSKLNATNPHLKFHERIRHLREFRNFTQEYMAEELKISQRAYSSIESGKTKLTLERLYHIAEVLGVSAGEIMGIENQNGHSADSNGSGINKEGGLVLTQLPSDKERDLYERLLEAKDEEIKILKEELKAQYGKQVR